MLLYLCRHFVRPVVLAVVVFPCILATFFTKTTHAQVVNNNKTIEANQEFAPIFSLSRLFDGSDQTFSAIIGRISQNLDVVFVAEGIPLKAALSADDVDILRKFALRADAQPKEIVGRVATCFDYDATFSNPHLVLLRKRYSSTDDIPFVTYEEGLRDLRHLSNVLNAFLSGSGKDSKRTFDDLVLSLSEDQLQGLSGNVPVSQLSKEQQNLVWRWTVLRYLRDVPSTVDGLVYHLSAVSSEHSTFRWFPLMDTDIQVFGYEGPFSNAGITNWAEIPLSHKINIALPNTVSDVVLPNTKANPNRNFGVILGALTPPPIDPAVLKHVQSELEELKVDGKAPDPDAPTPEDYAKRIAPLPPCTMTLKEAVAQVAHDFPRVQASVDDALATKPVSIVGMWNAAITARERIQALCDIYGLTLLHLKGNSFDIGLPMYNGDTKLSDVPAIIHCYVPLPWQRALTGMLPKAGDRIVADEQKRREAQGIPKVDSKMAALMRAGGSSRAAQALWFASARHKLRVAVQPLVEAAPDKRLPMRALRPETRQLLMFMVITDSLGNFYDVQQDATVPDYLTHFDQCFLLGHDSRSQNQIYFSLCTAGSDGKPKVRVSGGGSFSSQASPAK